MPQVDWSKEFASMGQQQPQQSRQQQQLQQQPQPLLPGGRLPPIQSARQPDPELQKRLLETLDKPPLPPLKPKPSLNGGRRRSKKSDTKKYKTRSKSRSRISTKRKNKNRRQTRK